MTDFYEDTLSKLIRRGVLNRDMRILVVCGGHYDHRTFQTCGFSNVTVSNLDDRLGEGVFPPFSWSFQDAENLDFEDDSFDFSIASLGLHHCLSPHKALLEMYRVSKLGLIVIEPLDNITSKVSTWLGLGQEYELAAVAYDDFRAGGVRNSPIPNYVYRWTPREIEKTINSFAPIGRHKFHYFYAMRLNWQRARMLNNKALLAIYGLLAPVAWVFGKIFRRECNNFAFVVEKPGIPSDLHPWLEQSESRVQLNEHWMRERYAKSQPECLH